MTGPEQHDELVSDLERAKPLDALRAEVAGLHGQLEDLRQSTTVAALGRVAREASALLRAMTHEDITVGPVGFDGARANLAEALGSFAEAAGADLVAAGLGYGPLADELAVEKATEDEVCPECHGRSSRSWDPCQRCKGSGRIDPFDFGIRTATVARGRDAP